MPVLQTLMAAALFVTTAGAAEPTDELLKRARATFDSVVMPPEAELAQPIVQLGQHLFWDARLSANGQIACASCHAATAWGADAERFSLDAKGKRTKRNSQTVFHAALQPALRWTGDRKSAAHQAEKSLTGSLGFSNAQDVVPLLQMLDYGPKFQQAFPADPAPLSPANYALAIEAYEKTLVTPAPFDQFLSGQPDALNELQQTGLRAFLDLGCADCHSGRLLGGERLEKFGVHHDYWTATGSINRDAGLFETSGDEADRDRFRTSMLRNIAQTGPYFHDGSVATLDGAVRVMAKVQLDQELDDAQVAAIEQFLHALTGQVPAHYSAPDPH